MTFKQKATEFVVTLPPPLLPSNPQTKQKTLIILLGEVCVYPAFFTLHKHRILGVCIIIWCLLALF